MEGNNDKWKSWLSRKYNGLIKGRWSAKEGIFKKVLMPHKDDNVQD